MRNLSGLNSFGPPLDRGGSSSPSARVSPAHVRRVRMAIKRTVLPQVLIMVFSRLSATEPSWSLSEKVPGTLDQVNDSAERTRSKVPGTFSDRLLFLALHELIGRSFQRSARGRTPENCFFNLLGQGKVLVGNAAGRVRLQLDPHLAPGDGQVGMVPGGLAEVTDGIGEHERRGPAVRVIFAAQPAVFQVPFA